MDKAILREIGLTDAEVRVYLSLMSLGSTPAGRIVRDTGAYRKNVYDALDKLIMKGLVTTVIENKVRYFQAKDPENLMRFLDEKKNRLIENEKELARQIPALKSRFRSLQPEIEAEIYRGSEGIKTILRECLDYRKVLLIGATGDVETKLLTFWPSYNRAREKLGVHWKLLLSHEAQGKPITKSKFYDFKVLPPELSGPNVIYIYGNNVANVLWLEKPVAFVVRHDSLAETYRKYFNYLWKLSK